VTNCLYLHPQKRKEVDSKEEKAHTQGKAFMVLYNKVFIGEIAQLVRAHDS
jgi:hypothetical protein